MDNLSIYHFQVVSYGFRNPPLFTVAWQNVKSRSAVTRTESMCSVWTHWIRLRQFTSCRQIVHLPLSHNRECLVGDHFDHQPDNRNALLCKSGGSHFGNHHIFVTAKGGCLWQQNNGNAKIRTPWWTISLMATPVCAESNVNTAARSSTPRPETANIAASRPAVTRCWICGKALKSVPNVERTLALAAGSSSYQFGRMPDIAAMPVGRKTTASVKRQFTLLF